MKRLRHAQLVAVWAALVVCAGCASHVRDLASVRASLVTGEVEQAVSEFEQHPEKDSDLLYLLERGHMMHVGGRWEESNQAFEAAEQRADELYTKSISRQALSFLTSDLTLPYRSTPHELWFVHYYRALNYLELGLPDEALVEARKANARLAQDEAGKAEGARRQAGAFLQYFTGLLYESGGEVNDAIVSLRDAARLYRAHQAANGLHGPPWLDEDYFAAAQYLGLDGETDSLGSEDSTLPARSVAHSEYNLVVFFESGFVPYREAVDIVLPIYTAKEGQTSSDESREAANLERAQLYVDEYGHRIYDYRADRVKLDHVLRFAFPQLIEAPTAVQRCELETACGRLVEAYPALDLASVTRADFSERLPGILLKTVARAIAKEAARKTVKKEDKILGWLVNAANVATEQADTRGWVFLPGRIDLLKARLEPGLQMCRARFVDADGATVEEWELELEIPQAGTRFVSLRSFQ